MIGRVETDRFTSLRSRGFDWLVQQQRHRPLRVLGVVALLTVAAAAIASRLELLAGFEHLLPDARPSVQELGRVASRTAGVSTLFVVLEGDDTAALRKAGDALVPALSALGPPWVGEAELTGTVGDHTVRPLAAAYFIGQSDDPSHTTVVYVFDAPVACADLGAAGWDTKVTDKTGALEMKLIGKSPAKYPVASGPNPAQREAAVNFTETSKIATPQEVASKSGNVQLDTLVDGKLATGTFDLTFAQGSLKESFSATWCPGGHEP